MSAPRHSASPARRVATRWLTAVAAVPLVLATAGWACHAAATATAPDPTRSLVVLPFVNASGDPELDALVEALRDDVSDVLTLRTPWRVIGHASAAAFRNKASDLDAIDRALAVEHVVEGRIEPAANGLRFSMQVRRTADRRQLGSRDFMTSVAGLGSLVADVTSGVVAAIDPSLQPAVAKDAVFVRSAAPEAWTLYARARQAQRSGTMDGLRRARDLAGQSAQRDPRFARAHLLSAQARSSLAAALDGPVAEADAAAIAADLDTAIRLDPDLAPAYAARAALAHAHRRDSAAANALFARALALTPHDPDALERYGAALDDQQSFDEAAVHLNRARAGDPLKLSIHLSLASLHLHAGRPADALAALGTAETIQPNSPYTALARTLTAIASGDVATGRAALARLRALAPQWHRTGLAEAVVSAAMGRRDTALAVLRAYEARERQTHPYLLGAAYAYAGDRDAGARWLEDAIARHDWVARHLLVDPLLDPVRREDWFRALAAPRSR